ncbi:hypothetical protein GCM10007897_06180 [Sphingobium jiangsuense]|uniref:DUF3617 family protein n=1 Tax=Sphingobium jiangsuense TaxID=870476 RepID=A0A7W6FNY1_9SPHN|nr:hypothetical protein [Sphingobium jiangsuense]MBB3925303.1 hypothetical protein [Sphingobium jiangsuense]GLS99239.1 hypothetical protein GCM10007897_06180 [Sphingobium jiangsuense]
MSQTHSLIVPLLLAAGLASCGQNAETAENTAATEGAAEAVSGGTAGMTAAEANTASANQATAPAAPEAVPAKAQAAIIAALPLKRGYYVESDTPCNQASNATTTLLRREGIGGARDFCEFKKIEQTGPNTYRVTEACGDLQDSAPPETSTSIYTLTGDIAFTAKSEHGWERSARYCAQSSMPPDWRANDISDVTG